MPPGDPDLGTPTYGLDESSGQEDDFACAESSNGLRLDKDAVRAALGESYIKQAQFLEEFAEALDAALAEAGDVRGSPLADEARAMAAAQREAYRALATKRDPLPEMRKLRRTTRRCLNRRRADLGMRPLPMSPRLPNVHPLTRPRPRESGCGAGAQGAASRGGTRGSPLDDDPHEEPPGELADPSLAGAFSAAPTGAGR